MQASLIISVCSETLMLLALQPRKLRHHFYIITLDIFAPSFFSYPSTATASWIPSTHGMLHSVTTSLSHPFLGFVVQETPVCLADFAALLPAATKDDKKIIPKDETQQLAASTPQHGSQQGGYLCVWGHWGQALNFSLDFAAFVIYWIDGAAHGWLTALLALGKKTKQEMALRFGMTDRQQSTSSLKINFKISQGWASGVVGGSKVGLGFIWKLAHVGLCKAEGSERGKKNQGQPQLLQAHWWAWPCHWCSVSEQSSSWHGHQSLIQSPFKPQFYFSIWQNEFLGETGGSGYMWGLWHAVSMKDYVCNLLNSQKIRTTSGEKTSHCMCIKLEH